MKLPQESGSTEHRSQPLCRLSQVHQLQARLVISITCSHVANFHQVYCGLNSNVAFGAAVKLFHHKKLSLAALNRWAPLAEWRVYSWNSPKVETGDAETTSGRRRPLLITPNSEFSYNFLQLLQIKRICPSVFFNACIPYVILSKQSNKIFFKLVLIPRAIWHIHWAILAFITFIIKRFT